MSTVTETKTTDALPTTPAVVVAPTPAPLVVSKAYLESAEWRKSWAMFFLSGGGIVMSLYTCAVLYIIQGHANYVYYLGLCAMINILIIFTGLLGLLVKRSINITKSGVIIEDHDSKD